MIDPIEARRRRRVFMVLFVGGLLLCSLLLYFLVYRPLLEDLGRLRTTAEMRQAALEEELSAQSVALKVGASEIEKWRRKVEELKKKLPDREDFENLLLEITGLAVKANLRGFSLVVRKGDGGEKNDVREASQVSVGYSSQASGEKRGTAGESVKAKEEFPVQSVTLQMSFYSGYRDLARFLRSLGATTRATRIDTVSVRKEGKRMVTSVRLRAYYRVNEGGGAP